MDLRRWTPLTFLFPGRYVDRSDRWDEFDLLAWSEADYEWTQDPWHGISDFAQRPPETVDSGRGDCEDYALVAVAWAVASDRDGVGIAFCWKPPYPWPRHVIAYDDTRVYSSGTVADENVDEWIENSEYSFAVRRPVTP
ncbi:MAG: hypothetical protein ACI8XM_002596 [Haloarculaceae archaeon]|jgi:hypothetical protein